MSSIINGFILFSLIITCAFLVGLLTFLGDHEKNTCEMTYMFEFPQFVKISHDLDEKYPKYGLYAYSEGRLTEKSRNMYFDGIPVLFIPGNAGSHRQGRSLASIALRKALNSRTPYHFDHFTIDINNEYSGLNGALLYEQFEYANSSIFTILNLYKERKNPPQYVVLIAHSVGGIIARRLVESNPNLIPIVLTLATPHKRPPLMLDSYSYNFYGDFNSSKLANTTFISVTGGYNDFLVSSFLTGVPHRDAINVATSHIPRSWVLADHKCIVWCKQTNLVLNRAFFDSVDPKTKHISTNPDFRKSMFHHHLLHHNGLNPFLRDSYPNSSANIKNRGEWIEYFGRQYTINVTKDAHNTNFYMLRLLDQPLHEAVTIVTINLETVEWAFVCGAHIPLGNKRICEQFTHLSHLTQLAPSALHKRRVLTLNMHDLQKTDPTWTHVILRALPSDNEVFFHVDTYRISDRRQNVNLPHMLSFKRHTLIEETPEKAVHFELVIPQLYHVMQSYQLYVESKQCTYEWKHATASLTVPWGNQDQHKYFTMDDNQPLHIRLIESRPQGAANESAVIQLTLDPNCRYKISVRSSVVGILGQMARFYSPLLIVNVAAVILMTLNSQMKSIANDRQCSMFFVAIKEGAKPYYILTSVKLISRVLSAKQFTDIFPVPDWLTMSKEGTDFFLLPLLLYVCSVGIVWLLGIFLFVSLVVCETTVHKLSLKFLAKTVSFTVSWSDYVMSALHKLPFVVAATLVCLSVTTTGGLALAVGTVFYFLRLTQMSQDYIEELVWYYVKKVGQKLKRNKPEVKNERTKDDKKPNNNNNNNESETSLHDAMFFHSTIFFIWALVTIINLSSVLTWAHSFKFSTKLNPDPAFWPGLVMSACALPLWQLDLPKIERKGYNEVGMLMSVLGVASLIYAPLSIFRLNYTLPAAIVAVTVHQLVAPNRDLTVEQPRQVPTWLDVMKAKIE